MPAPGGGLEAAFLFPDEAQLTWRRPTRLTGSSLDVLFKTPVHGCPIPAPMPSTARARDVLHGSLITLGIELEPGRVDDDPEPFDDEVGAVVDLIEAAEPVGVSIRLSMARTTAIAMVDLMLGRCPDTVTVNEFLKELANLAGGALKRMLPTSVALGLPHALSEAARPPVRLTTRRREFRLRSLHGPMRCTLTTRTAERLVVRPEALREGQVIARDVRNEGGELLAGAGARLTRAGVRKLREALDLSSSVEVVDDD